MTKSQRNKTINKLVYQYVESLGYEVDTTDNDVLFLSKDGNRDNDIYYRRSTQDACALNWASEKTKEDEIRINSLIHNLNTYSDETLEELID